jgi:hypothetical protein
MSRSELEELHELRKLKENLPALIQKTREETFVEFEMRKLRKLHARDKENPEQNRERARKWYAANKDRKKKGKKSETGTVGAAVGVAAEALTHDLPHE